jgi:glycosyltransferase involved in cell wall biosynthesis
VTPYVPYDGIDHAGGAYLQRYLRCAVALGWEVRVIAPASPANLAAIQADIEGIEFDLHPDTPKWARPVNLLATGVPLRTGELWWRSLSERAHSWLAEGDLIDLQWSDSLWSAPTLRRHVPHARLTGLAHDLRSVSVVRALRRSRGRARVEAALARSRVTAAERRALSAVDHLFVFKNEDRAWLRDHGVSTDVRLAPVPLPSTTRIPAPSAAVRRILFTGAMYRPENVEGVLWFAREVWPLVRSRVPDVRWRIAGARPSPDVMALASETVEVTGYMDDLLSAYVGVGCVVVPLRRGAGVKFKTVEAVAGGYPVVTTSIGAEGVRDVVGVDLPLVFDDPMAFAEAVTRVLTFPDVPLRNAAVLRDAATRQLTFEARIHEMLSTVS